MKYLFQVLITVALIASYHVLAKMSEATTVSSTTISKKAEPDIQTLAINQPRVASVVEYAIKKDMSWNDPVLHKYALKMNKEISGDVKNGLFYEMVLPTKMFDMGSEVLFREEWIVDVQEENRELVTKFPKGGILVMHLEKVLYPECQEEEEPMLLFLALTKKGTVIKRSVEYRAEMGGWRVFIGGEDGFELNKLNHRALVKRGCRKKQEGK